jgi:hypothetical protein
MTAPEPAFDPRTRTVIDADALIRAISESYGVEPRGGEVGSLDGILAYVDTVLAQNAAMLDREPVESLPEEARRARLAGAIVWSILSRMNMRELVGTDRARLTTEGGNKALDRLQFDLDELATSIEDYKIPGDGPKGYVRGLRHAATMARDATIHLRSQS